MIELLFGRDLASVCDAQLRLCVIKFFQIDVLIRLCVQNRNFLAIIFPGIYSNDAILDGLEGDSGSVNSGMFDSSTPPNSNGVAMGSSVPNGSPNMGMVQANDKAANGILLDEGGSYDYQSSSVIKLTNGSVMVLKEVNRYLALVFIMRDDHYNVGDPRCYLTLYESRKKYYLK